MCRGITSPGSPAPRRRNVAVPSGTIRLLHNSLKLQQRWHCARILTRFPAFIFPFLPPDCPAVNKPSLHSSHSQNLVRSVFFCLPWRPYTEPISAPAVVRENITALVWKSDVIRHITADHLFVQTAVTTMTCREGACG